MGREKIIEDDSELFVDDLESDIEEGNEGNIEAKETPASKRRRLVKGYIDEIKLNDEDGEIENRIRTDQLITAGKILKNYSKYIKENGFKVKELKSGRKDYRCYKTITCVEVVVVKGKNESCIYIYSGYKDGTVLKWNLNEGKLLNKYVAPEKFKHDGVSCISASSDGLLLAVGRNSRYIDIWSIPEDKHIGILSQHKKAITGLSFRNNTHTLYSCSMDQTVIVWDADALKLVDRLFGHEDGVSSIDSLNSERCITSGAKDKTVRYWKIPEESQLIFREKNVIDEEDDIDNTGLNSIEAVASIDENLFVSSSDIGSISLWSRVKKKPIFILKKAHDNKDGVAATSGIGIFSLSAIHYTDIFASGSNTGSIKLWEIAKDRKSFHEILSIPMNGYISSLKLFDPNIAPPRNIRNHTPKLCLAVARAKEHRLGRWSDSIKDANNGIYIIELN